jgi:RNA polymerase sigma factor (sigma-70 family)
MTSLSFSHLDRLVEHLPFPLDATEEVNAAFARWRDHQNREDEKIVALWTYCFVMRYFLVKAVRGTIRSASDLDALIATVYRKTDRKRDSVQNASRYASWVSVICKNTLINYVNRKRPEQSIQDEQGPVLTAESSATYHDAGFVLQALHDAIERLPSYLQETARLYFLQEFTYEEISEQIGKSVPTVRSYRHKAVQKFREDDRLLAFLQPEDPEEAQ